MWDKQVASWRAEIAKLIALPRTRDIKPDPKSKRHVMHALTEDHDVYLPFKNPIEGIKAFADGCLDHVPHDFHLVPAGNGKVYKGHINYHLMQGEDPDKLVLVATRASPSQFVGFFRVGDLDPDIHKLQDKPGELYRVRQSDKIFQHPKALLDDYWRPGP